ncbi:MULTISPECIES: Ig-like domain-containing protein [unclassified Serratia (in: enterobacteria)]|uniref:Ig-like domain-containing protein n=1 Tax=unclassified Serratia (in: enterobacteria) TaxID=2647522 RepID=UPI0030767451
MTHLPARLLTPVSTVSTAIRHTCAIGVRNRQRLMTGLVALSVMLQPFSAIAASLTLGNNVVIQSGENVHIHVRARLQAGKNVMFTGLQNTTASIPPGSPTAGNWGGLHLYKSAAAYGPLTLSDLTLRDGGRGHNGTGVLNVYGWNPGFNNLQLTDNLVGLTLHNAAPSITSSSFLRNTTSIQANNSAASITGSHFSDAESGISNTTPATVVSAQNTWWGHPSGPTITSNPGGQGTPVTEGVTYTPYQNAAPLLHPRISLVNPAAYYTTPAVTLELSCLNATEYRLSETSDFNNAVWQSLPSSPHRVTQTLSDTDGKKSLHVQYRSTTGEIRTTQLSGDLLLDRTPPALTLDYPVSGSTLDGTETLRVTVSDPSGIRDVRYFLNSTLIGTLTGSPYALDWDASQPPAGIYTLRAIATDNAGRQSEQSASITLLGKNSGPDTDGPVLSALTYDGKPLTDGITLTRSATLALKATDRSGVSRIQLNIDGTPAGSFTAAGNDRYTLAVNLTSFESGSHTFTLNAFDTLENSSTLSLGFTFSPDNNVPAPVTGLTATALAAGKVRLAWTRSTDPNVTGYHLYRAATPFTQTSEAERITSAPTTATNWDDLVPHDGQWHYRVVSVNSLNTPSELSNPASITIDTALPHAEELRYTPHGKVDPETGHIGQGRLELTLLMNKPLQSAPYLALVPEGGAPLVITLTAVDPLTWRGELLIDSTTPSGLAHAVLSARDLTGNRGTDIKKGDSLTIDTVGPILSDIQLTPAAPIKNQPAQTLTVRFTYNKPVVGTPKLTYLLSGPVRSPESVGTLTALDPTTWQATFPLPADAGLGAPETLQFRSEAIDTLDNHNTKIAAYNRYQIYQGTLPPLPIPLGLTAKSRPAGAIQLTWQPVDDAHSYQLYRQGPGQSTPEPLTLVSGTEHLDPTPKDGTYHYTLASVRQANGENSLSGQSPAVSALAIHTGPGAPRNLTLTLTGAGILAQWQAPLPNNNPTYNLYRAGGTQITSTDGLTPLKTGLKTPQAIDPYPQAEQSAYIVTAVDLAGNESAPSNSTYLNASLLPVTHLVIEQHGDTPPVLTWNAPNGTLTGYHIYLGQAPNKTRLTSAPISPLTYTDTGYTSGERYYTVASVDAQGEEIEHTLHLPAINAQITSGLPLKRGIMNRLELQITNTSSVSLDNIQALVKLPIDPASNRILTHRSEPFSLGVNQTRLVPVIVGGYTDLPGTLTAHIGIEHTPHENGRITVTRNQNLDVTDGALVVGMATEDFTRGGTGKLRLTIENTTDVDLELLTATRNGADPSTELRLRLLDADGNTLSVQPYHQTFGAGVITLASGQTVARIPAGTTYTSDTFPLNIPASSPDTLRVRLEVDTLRYHTGQPDQITITGKGSERTVKLIDTAYTGDVTDVTPLESFGDQDILIRGKASSRATGTLLGNTPLKIILNQQGFERSLTLMTDADGTFTYRHTPTLTDAGLYKVSAVHPDITDRPEQKTFQIHRITAGPTPYKLDIPKNYPFTIPFTAKAGPGTSATNLRLALNPASQPTGVLPAGIQLELPPPVSLTEKQTRSLPVKLTADNSAQPSGALILDLISDTHASAIGHVRINYTLTEGTPYLISDPKYLETGMSAGDTLTETLRITNKGLQEVVNLKAILTKENGETPHTWVTLSSAVTGNLGIGEQRPVDITFSPPKGTPDGTYPYTLTFSGDNLAPHIYTLYLNLTQSGKGDVLFKTSDIYTATLGKDNQLIAGLAGATLTLQHEDIASLKYEKVTDTLGEALFKGLPAGRYQYKAKAKDHQERGGRLQIKPGVQTLQPVFLDYNLINVEWSVKEIVIEDRYEIIIDATFETDVPAAVIVLQPYAINLPKMQTGDVYYGELTLTNYGLIRADELKQTLPREDGYFRYEFLAEVPETLEAKQRLVLPYRIIALKSLEDSASAPNASGGGCYNYSNSTAVGGCFECQNGEIADIKTSSSWFSNSNSSCSSSGGGGGGSGGGGIGGGGGWSHNTGGSSTLPMKGKKCAFVPGGMECN